MNIKVIKFIKNLSYALISNIVSLFVSIMVILILPKTIGVEDYGYFQLYLFYSTYVGFLHLGWIDGIYLKSGGKEYKNLDKKVLFSQFYMLLLFQFIIAIVISIVSILFIHNQDQQFLFQILALCTFLTNLRFLLVFILQSTNRIQEYSNITLIDRILYLSLIVFFVVFGAKEFRYFITADLIGKFLSLLVAVYYCKDIVFGRISNFYFSFRETFDNISIGIKLMFANIANMLIVGIVRFGIERSWGVATFGKVSLSLSLSNFIMIFINSLGIIMFPILRRANERELPTIYLIMKNLLMVSVLGLLILYYPLKIVLSEWLPNYKESLMYLALVFPILIFEGKMSLLINTYFKTLRKEKIMLKINLIIIPISIVITLITTLMLNSIDLAVLSVVIILSIRCVLSELILSKLLNIIIYKDIILELAMTLVFIITAWYLNTFHSIYIYVIAYVLYLFVKRKEIKLTIVNLKSLIKN